MDTSRFSNLVKPNSIPTWKLIIITFAKRAVKILQCYSTGILVKSTLASNSNCIEYKMVVNFVMATFIRSILMLLKKATQHICVVLSFSAMSVDGSCTYAKHMNIVKSTEKLS